MEFPQNLAQIYQLIRQKQSNKCNKNYRFKTLLKYFNISIPSSQVIKIAGTNGKGSVSAMIEAMAIADDKKVILFTSPHLYNITERFRINGQEIPTNILDQLAKKTTIELINFLEKEGNDMVPSFFEILTIIALKTFKLYQADLIILEAGIGGYNDIIHLIDGQISAITSIGLDHTNQLGSTLPEIAADKVGIASNNSILILGSDLPNSAKNIIIKDAVKRNIKIVQANKNNFEFESLGFRGCQINLKQDLENMSFILPLIGSFQIENFSTAKTIFKQLIVNQIISDKNSLKGVSNVYWPGRMEVITGNPTWLLDAAHNGHAIEKISQELPNLMNRQKVSLLLGLSDHNNSDEIIPYLEKLIKIMQCYIYLTSGFYRAIDPKEYVDCFNKNTSNLIVIDNYKTAINHILNIYHKQNNQIILITGSLFLVGECRKYLQELGVHS
ncbi:MAG TPA: bifunctional folylpolyglutamate synthase/dihydrofolate synthase [Cyanothece sp. UBA12306]|nr:bifunctional folylpolyglutamate synthase/dihydrofolate synthase [Cyanothece sp. UBA12306]